MIKDFSQEELFRYSRQLMLPGIGLEGQRKFKDAAVLIVGAGGLASPISIYLAAAGIGRIGIVDHDRVDLSNLHRQTLYDMRALGHSKAESARRRLLEINPTIQVDVHETPFTTDNAFRISQDFDILVDGSDNLPTRYLINDLCVLTKRPFVYGAVGQFDGQISLFDATIGPCYRCAFGEPPPPEKLVNSQDNGILGILPGLVGLLQAAEVLKIILNVGESLAGKLVLINALETSFEHVVVNKDPDCKICGDNPQITALIDYTEYCGASYNNKPLQAQPLQEISPQELAQRLKTGQKFHLIDIRTKNESQISHIPGAEQIPYLELSQNMEKFDRSDEFVLFCRNGSKSIWAQRIMHAANFKNVRILRGGINAWAQEVDPSESQY